MEKESEGEDEEEEDDGEERLVRWEMDGRWEVDGVGTKKNGGWVWWPLRRAMWEGRWAREHRCDEPDQTPQKSQHAIVHRA